MFGKRNKHLTIFFSSQIKWEIHKAYHQTPSSELVWSFQNKPLEYSKCPFLFFSLLSSQNKSSWREGISKWQPGPVCGCSISILNKVLFNRLKQIFVSIHLTEIPPKICAWFEHGFHIELTNPCKPAPVSSQQWLLPARLCCHDRASTDSISQPWVRLHEFSRYVPSPERLLVMSVKVELSCRSSFHLRFKMNK